MDSFNENIGNLLVASREKAFDGLRSIERYNKLEQEQNALRLELEAISPEAKKLAEKYFNAVVGVHAYECNASLLCGMTVLADLRKRFDSSTAEYLTFAQAYLDYDYDDNDDYDCNDND